MWAFKHLLPWGGYWRQGSSWHTRSLPDLRGWSVLPEALSLGLLADGKLLPAEVGREEDLPCCPSTHLLSEQFFCPFQVCGTVFC